MNDKSQQYSLWETIFSVLIAVSVFLPRGHAVDPAHAQASALFRLSMTLVGVIGLVVVSYKKKHATKMAATARLNSADNPPVNPNAPVVGQNMVTADNPAFAEIIYASHRASHWRCNLYILFRRPQTTLLVYLFPLLMSLGLISRLTTPGAPLALAEMAAILIGWTIFLLLVLWAQISQRFPMPDTMRVCTTSLTAQGFQDATPDKIGYTPWPLIGEIREQDGDVYFFRGLSEGNFIPREAFRDRHDAAAFVETARALKRGEKPAHAPVNYSQIPNPTEGVWPPPPRPY